MSQGLVLYFLLRVTVENLSACLFYAGVTHQRILLDHISIFCFVFSDRFYGRQSDNFLEGLIQLINQTLRDNAWELIRAPKISLRL